MFTAIKLVEQKTKTGFPKLMIREYSASTNINSYYAIVLFEKEGCGMCLQTNDLLPKAGIFYANLDMANFKDYEDGIELRNIVG